jgi:hypothetical protein
MTTVGDAAVRMMLRSQYHASLAMVREPIERCPEDLWYDDRPTNAFWQIAYYALYFTHLYLRQTRGPSALGRVTRARSSIRTASPDRPTRGAGSP